MHVYSAPVKLTFRRHLILKFINRKNMLCAVLSKLLKKFLIRTLTRSSIGVNQQHLRLHLDCGRLLLQHLQLDTSKLSQPNSLLQLQHASLNHLQLIIDWKHLLTERITLIIHDVLIVGELVNRLRNKHEILRDKIRILQDDIRRMVEKQVEGTIGRYVKKKMLAVIIRNLHVEVGKVTFQLREEKAFDINFTIDRFQFRSVPNYEASKVIHKIIRLEMAVYSLTESRMRRDILETVVTGEGQFIDADDLAQANVTFSVNPLKLSIDVSELPKLLRKFDPLARPNQREPLQRPYKNQLNYGQELLKYFVKTVIQKLQQKKFLTLLAQNRYDFQLLKQNQKFQALVFRLPIELLRHWISQDSRLIDRSINNSPQQNRPLFQLAKYSIDIGNIDLRIIMSKDIFAGRVSSCSASIQFSPTHTTILANIFSLNISFNSTQVIQKIVESRPVLELFSKQFRQQMDVKVEFENLKFNFSDDLIRRLLKTYYRLFPKQVTIRTEKLAVKKKEVRVPLLIQITLKDILVGLYVSVDRQNIYNYLLVRRVVVGKVNHIIKCETNIDHKFFIQDKEVRVLDGVNIQLELVRGKETILILRDTSVKCNVGNVGQFLGIAKKLVETLQKFTDYFKTRQFQVYNCQKIGLATYIPSQAPNLNSTPSNIPGLPMKPPVLTAAMLPPNKPSYTYYYTVDGASLFLFPIHLNLKNPKQPAKPVKQYSIKDVTSLQPLNKSFKMSDGSSIVFTSNRQFKQVRDLYELANSNKEESIPLIILIQKTQIGVGFTVKSAFEMRVDIEFCKFSMKNQQVSVLVNTGLSLKCLTTGLDFLQTDRLSVGLEKLPRRMKVMLNFADLNMDYSETALMELASLKETFADKGKSAANKGKQVVTEKTNAIKEETEFVLGMIMDKANIFFIVNDNNKFVKISLFGFYVNLDQGLTFQGFVQAYDLTSYPYTRFMGEQRMILQLKIAFNDMNIVVSGLRCVFMLEVFLRILDYSLEQVDNILKVAVDPKPEPPKSSTIKVTIQEVVCSLYPTILELYTDKNIQITYKKKVWRSKDVVVSTETSVQIYAPFAIRCRSQQILSRTLLTFYFNMQSRLMQIRFRDPDLPPPKPLKKPKQPKQAQSPKFPFSLSLTPVTFNLMMRFLFNNLAFSDGLQLQPAKTKKQTDPKSTLDVDVEFDAFQLTLKGVRLKFDLSTDKMTVNYGRKGLNSKVEVDFYKLRVKEQRENEKISIVNDFGDEGIKIKEDIFKSRDRKILTMKMTPGAKTEIDLIFQEIQILGNMDKIVELAGFFKMNRESPGIKPNTVSAGSSITVQFPKIHVYLQTDKRQYYILSLYCLINLDTNTSSRHPQPPIIPLQPTTSNASSPQNPPPTPSVTSILKIHLNDINLRNYSRSNQRNITNKPAIQLLLETVKELKQINPKSVQNLTVRFENSRFSLSLEDLRGLHSVITSQQRERQEQMAVKQQQQGEEIVVVEEVAEDDQEEFDAVQALDNSLNLTLFQIEIEQIDVIISNSYSQLLLPLIQFNMKCQKLCGTINQLVTVLNFKSNLYMGYFNLGATRIQPIIQPFQLILELCLNTLTDPSFFISLVIPKLLVNLSDQMLRTYRMVSSDLRKAEVEYSSVIEHNIGVFVREILGVREEEIGEDVVDVKEPPEKNLVTLFSMKNQTGFTLKVMERVEKEAGTGGVMTGSVGGTGGSEIKMEDKQFAILRKQQVAYYRVTENQYDFGKTFDKSTKFNLYFKDSQKNEYIVKSVKIHNMLRNESYVKYPCLDAHTLLVVPDKYFISVIDITHYKKEFILKSKLYFKNKSITPMNIRLTDGEKQINFSLNTGQQLPIPFTQYLHPNMQFQIKYPAIDHFSKSFPLCRYMLTDKQAQLFLKQHSTQQDRQLVVPDRQMRMSILNVNLLIDSKSRVQTITIMPMMRIYNYTPLDIHFNSIEIVVPANEETYVNQCPTPLKSIVTMREFTTKTEILLYNVQMEEEQYDSLITLHQETTGIKPKSLNINIKRKKRKGIFEILLSARIVIINETGLPLLVYLDECKSSQKVILANQTDKMKLTSLTNTDYSQTLDLKQLPHTYQLKYLEKPSEDSPGQLYELYVNTSLHQAYYSTEMIITKVIEITPKYVVDNQTPYELEVTQPESFIEPIRYEAGKKGVLFWPDPNLERKVVVRAFEKEDKNPNLSKWKWSGAFSIEISRIIYFYIKRKASTKTTRQLLMFTKSVTIDAERLFFKAQVKRFAEYTCLLITNLKKQDIEYLLQNDTKYIVLFEQLNKRDHSNKDYFAVKPFSQAPFSWIEPDLKKKIKVSILDGERIVESTAELSFETSTEEEIIMFPRLSIRFRIRLLNTDKKIVEVTTVEKEGAAVVKPMKVKKPIRANFITVLIKQIGVSLIATPQTTKLELFFTKMDYIMLTIQQAATLRLEFSIKDMNIDNNTRSEAVYPVLLTSTMNLEYDFNCQFFEFVYEKECESKSPIKKILELRVSLVPLTIKMDQSLAKVLLFTYRKLYSKKDSQYIQYTSQNFKTINFVFGTTDRRKKMLQNIQVTNPNPYVQWQMKSVTFSTNFVHIQKLQMPTIQINLTFNHIYSLRRGGNQVFGSLYASFGLVIPNFENAPITIRGVQAHDIMDATSQAIVSEMVRIYKNQIISNVMGVIGSVNIIGNPVRIFLMIKHGATQVIDKPKRAAMLGPAAIVLASLQGISGFLKAVLGSTLHFMHSITGALTNGFVIFSFDDIFIDKRREINRFEPEDILTSLEYSFRSIAYGFQSAFGGLNFSHRRYHNQNFGLSTVKALSGLVIKPVSGMLDSFRHILKGTQNMMTSQYYRPNQNRRRRMRVFYQKIRYFKEYSEVDAKIMQFLNSDRKFAHMMLIDCIHLKATNVTSHLVLTIEYIIMIEGSRISWSIKPKEVHSIGYIPADKTVLGGLRDRSKVVLYYDNKNRGHTIFVDQDDHTNMQLYRELKRVIEDLKNI